MKLLEFKYKFATMLPGRALKGFPTKDRTFSSLLKGPVYKADRSEMKRVFEKMDVDRDGKLSEEDLVVLLTALKRTEGVKETAKNMLWASNMDGDGKINFDAFMGVVLKGTVSTGDIKAAFLYMDMDNDGKIGTEDLYKVMQRLQEKCTREDCQRMVASVDRNGVGLVDMWDFRKMMTKTMQPIVS